jgi:hypothetical protein
MPIGYERVVCEQRLLIAAVRANHFDDLPDI